MIFLFMVLIITLTSNSQTFHDLSKVPPLKKGKITLSGSSMKFHKLTIENDTVMFFDLKGVLCKYPGQDILKISKSYNLAGTMALCFGIPTIVCSPAIFLVSPEQRGSAFAVYFATMAGITGVASLIGFFITGEKVIYENHKKLGFYPTLQLDQMNRLNAGFTFKVKLN